jgi:hypothetical protein
LKLGLSPDKDSSLGREEAVILSTHKQRRGASYLRGVSLPREDPSAMGEPSPPLTPSGGRGGGKLVKVGPISGKL